MKLMKGKKQKNSYLLEAAKAAKNPLPWVSPRCGDTVKNKKSMYGFKQFKIIASLVWGPRSARVPHTPYWHGVPADRSAGDRAGIARTPVRADALKGMRCAHFHKKCTLLHICNISTILNNFIAHVRTHAKARARARARNYSNLLKFIASIPKRSLIYLNLAVGCYP